MSQASDEILGLLRGDSVDAAEIRSALDAMSHAERVAATRALDRDAQRTLYGAVEGLLPLVLRDLVPAGVDDFTPVRHHGRNTLPAFNFFEKRFCRPRGEDREKPGVLYGFNFQTLSKLTGPGYFLAVEDPNRPEIWVDYNRVPEAHPDGWPEIRSNTRGLSRFVYGFMIDTLRRVSEHVTIGSAARKGTDLGSWFVLVRED